MENIICPWESPELFLFSSNVPFLLPYSHFIALIASIFTAIILFRSKEKTFGKIFLIMSCIFSLWVLIDWHIWATNRSNIVMFLWSIQILIELLVYIFGIYLSYLFINKKEPKEKYKILGVLTIVPIVILLPTKFILSGIDLSYCDAVENPFIVFYSYTLEALVMLVIIHTIFKGLFYSKNNNKTVVAIFGLGIITFLLAFTSGNIVGSITENWEYAQFGLFGMPIFMGLISYSIMKYKAFNTKVIGTQILVGILLLLTSGILFLRTIERVRIITAATLIIVFVLGYILIKSVQREVSQREKIENLAKDLERANEKLRELDQMKSEFLSLATHQIRSPLTAIKGYSSMMLDGDYGEFPIKARNAVRTIMTSSQNLINIVGDFLDISRIEQGRMAYNKEIFEIGELVKEALDEIMPNIKKAGLEIKTKIPENFSAKTTLDKGKMKQIISNLIDNAIKYTPKGSINISLENQGQKTIIKIKDTGIGIEEKDIDKLFTKFTRTKDAFKTNVLGTGLGLYIAKKMMEAQGGNIHVESDGLGKGSMFIIEIPRTLG